MTCFYKSFPLVLTCVETASTEAPMEVYTHTHIHTHTYTRTLEVFFSHSKDMRAVVTVHLGAEEVFSRKHICSFGFIGF